MKKTFLLTIAAMLVAWSQLSASIVYHDINPDVTISNPGPNGTWNIYTIDFDQDGNYDIEFNNRFDPLVMVYTYNGNTLNYNEVAIIASPASMDTAFMNPFSAGQTIGPGFPNWTSRTGNGWIYTFLWIPSFTHIIGQGDVIMGVRFKAGSGGPVHYGWVRLELTNNLDLILKDYAWEDVAGTAIQAGIGPVQATSISIQGQGGASQISAIGGTLQMQATVLPSNANNKSVTWAVNNLTGAGAISSSGLLTGQAAGTVEVIGTTNDGSNLSDTAIITIGSAAQVSAINITSQGNQTSINNHGGTLQLFAQVLPANAGTKTVTWSVTSGFNVVTVSQSGLVTAVEDGIATVRATAQDGTNVYDEITLSVSNQNIPVSAISVSSQSGLKSIVDPGGSLQMRATVLPVLAANRSVGWLVENRDGRASISSTGSLQAIADGKVRVSAHALDGSGVSSSPFVVTIYNQALNNDEEIKTAFTLSPNPVQHSLNIRSDKPIHSVKVFLPNGKLVKKVVVGGASLTQVSLEGLLSGVYFIQLSDIDGHTTVKPISKM